MYLIFIVLYIQVIFIFVMSQLAFYGYHCTLKGLTVMSIIICITYKQH